VGDASPPLLFCTDEVRVYDVSSYRQDFGYV
jgi:hypothetical protein